MLHQKEQLNVTDAQHARQWDSVFRDGRHWVRSKLQALIECTKSLHHLLILSFPLLFFMLNQIRKYQYKFSHFPTCLICVGSKSFLLSSVQNSFFKSYEDSHTSKLVDIFIIEKYLASDNFLQSLLSSSFSPVWWS